MKQAFYIVPNIIKISGGPRTRISSFKTLFLSKGTTIFENRSKKNSLKAGHFDLLYIESATNRISFWDVIYLFKLKFSSKKRVVFIRDIYIELFPEEYTSIRARITLICNRLSNFYLTWIATQMVFPTQEMGKEYFAKNKMYPKRPFTDLPPATHNITTNRSLPDFSNKIGILYLGSLGYTNSGYQQFLNFSEKYATRYNCFILSGDQDLAQKTQKYPVTLNKVKRDSIPEFIAQHNIAYAFHTRPRNRYDDITYPIKVLDFLSFQLPFISEKHVPLCNLLSNDYPLFASYENLEDVNALIQSIDITKYEEIVANLKETALNNTYEKRYKKLHSL
ncbi:MAG: hypothetical protein ACI849_000719 [Patiriisocius sp.]|jgi:hypothetical protein